MQNIAKQSFLVNLAGKPPKPLILLPSAEELQRPCAYEQKRRHIYASWSSLCPTLLGPLCPMEFRNQGQRCPPEAELTSLFAHKVREREKWAAPCISAPGRHTDSAHLLGSSRPGTWNLAQPDSCSLLWGKKNRRG